VEELQVQLDTNHDAIASTRDELEKFNTQLEELGDKMHLIEQDYASAEQEYSFATATFNDSNLQLPSSKASSFIKAGV